MSNKIYLISSESSRKFPPNISQIEINLLPNLIIVDSLLPANKPTKYLFYSKSLRTSTQHTVAQKPSKHTPKSFDSSFSGNSREILVKFITFDSAKLNEKVKIKKRNTCRTGKQKSGANFSPLNVMELVGMGQRLLFCL